MTKKQLPASAPKHVLPSGFSALLGDVKLRIQTAQTQAMTRVNAELVRLYWDIGRLIEERQQQQGWGASVIPRLSAELRNELPELKGFSERNIGLMCSFYRVYPDGQPILQQAVAKLPSNQNVPQAVAQIPPDDSLLWSIPWGHHAVLIAKVKDPATRRWYMEQILVGGWSRNVLTAMIDGKAHERTGKAITNFEEQLPSPQSDLAQQALKDPYIFDFLTLTEPFHERELETGLVRHLEKFLLELGQGFAFVGRQYRLSVADDFYCNVVNDQLRHFDDQPTIGLILCQSKDNVLAEYSLAGIDKPIGISSYELTRALPANLQSALPTVEEIEAELAAAKTTEKVPKKKTVIKRKAVKKLPGKKKPKRRKRDDD